MRIVCWQAILLKYHALFVIFEKAANYDSVVCCKFLAVLYTRLIARRWFNDGPGVLVGAWSLRAC